MANHLTDEQETLLAHVIERARNRAKRAWKITIGFSGATPDEAFDKGFEDAMEFALSDEFGQLISRLKAMLSGE